MKTEVLNRLIDESENIVCLAGLALLKECGYPNYRNDKDAYEIEQNYGYSPEELFSAAFYATRKNLFFKFYREFFLEAAAACRRISPSFEALARLERLGKLKAVVTRNIFGMAQKAGCKSVVELHGSIENNYCPRCHKSFSVDYVRGYKDIVPLCDDCQVPLRPGVLLMGETIRIEDTSLAAEYIAGADMLIVAGTHLKSYLAEKFLKYYKGKKLVLINDEQHFSDQRADYIFRAKPEDILPKVV